MTTVTDTDRTVALSSGLTVTFTDDNRIAVGGDSGNLVLTRQDFNALSSAVSADDRARYNARFTPGTLVSRINLLGTTEHGEIVIADGEQATVRFDRRPNELETLSINHLDLER